METRRRSVAERLVLGGVAAGVLLAMLGGCAAPSASESDAEVSGERADWSSLRWDPAPLADAGPALVGWLQRSGVEPGSLVALAPATEPRVLWRQTGTQQPQVQVVDVTSDGPRMVGIGYDSALDGGLGTALLFDSDGSVEPLPIPRGYEDLIDVAFTGDDVLVLAYHIAPEGPEVALGAVGTDGAWTDLELVGELPEYHFIESLVAVPGTDVVGIVLKTPGGSGNRDDDALVLARRVGSELQAFTPPYRDDSLPGCEPLWDAQGVVFGRTWSEGPNDAGAYVRAAWDGISWGETVLAPARDGAIPLEAGTVVAQRSDGTYLVRGSAPAATDGFELYDITDGGGFSPAGVDVTAVGWYAWID